MNMAFLGVLGEFRRIIPSSNLGAAPSGETREGLFYLWGISTLRMPPDLAFRLSLVWDCTSASLWGPVGDVCPYLYCVDSPLSPTGRQKDPRSAHTSEVPSSRSDAPSPSSWFSEDGVSYRVMYRSGGVNRGI